MNNRMIVSLVTSAAAIAAMARPLQNQPYDGKWSDEKSWYDTTGKTNAVPIAQDSLSFLAYWNSTNRLDADVSLPLRGFSVSATSKNGGSFNLLGTGHTLENTPYWVDWTEVEYANKAAFPAEGESGKIYVALDTGAKYWFRTSDKTYRTSFSGLAYLWSPSHYAFQHNVPVTAAGSVFKFTDPVIVASNANDLTTFYFKSGTFNFYDPDGVGNDSDNYLFNNADKAEIVFGAGSSSRFGTVRYGGAGSTETTIADTFVRFLGGSHYIKELNWWAQSAYPRKMALELSGGAVLTAGSVDMNYSTPTAGAVAGQPFRPTLAISGGAKLLTGDDGFVATIDSVNAIPEVRLDNGTLGAASGSASPFKFTTWNAAGATNIFTAVNGATLDYPDSSVAFGYPHKTATGTTLVAMTNATVNAKYLELANGVRADFSDVTADVGFFTTRSGADVRVTDSDLTTASNKFYMGSSVIFKDATVTSEGNVYVGAAPTSNETATDPARVVFDGGTYTFKKALNVAISAAETAHIVITNGAKVSLGDESSVVNGEKGARALIEVADATLESASNFWLGNWSSGYTLTAQSGATMRLKDGATFNAKSTLAIGRYCAPGTLIVEDGATLSVSAGLWMNYNSFGGHVNSITNRYIQNGGSASCTTFKLTCGEDNCEAWFLGGTTKLQQLYGVMDSRSGLVTGKAFAKVFVNGGTLKYAWNPSTPFIKNLTSLQCGPKGLTVTTESSAGYPWSSTIAFPASNMDGEEGFFRINGGGTLSLVTNEWTVSRTVVEGGATFQIGKTAAAAPTLETALAVVDGAKFSLEGDTTGVTLDGFAVTNATIVLDAGDTITVPADKVSLNRVTVSYVTTPEVGTTNSFLVTTGGPLSAANVRVLRGALLDNAIGADENVRTIFDYDAETQRTTVRLAVLESADELTDRTELESGADWSTATWSAGVPDVTKVAVVADKSVNVDKAATVGALEVGGDTAAITGTNAITVASDVGAARLYGFSAAASVAAPIVLETMATITNAADTVLSLAGGMDGAGYVKTGKGRLEVSGTNSFYRQIQHTDGRLLVRNAEALNADPLNAGAKVVDGTLTFAEPDDKEMRIEAPIVFASPETRGATIIECRTPVTLANWQTIQQGGLLKRGIAPLTIEVGKDLQLNAKCAMTWNTYLPSWSFTFAEDGTPPDGASLNYDQHYYAGFNVVEGEVIFKALSDLETRPVITSKCLLLLNLYTTDGTATPTITLDGVDLDLSNLSYLINGNGYDSRKHITQAPVFRILNGARAYGNDVMMKQYGYENGSHPLWAITNGTLQAKSSFWLDWLNVDGVNLSSGGWTDIRTKDAEMLSDTTEFCLDGQAKADFASTYFGPTDKTKYGSLRVFPSAKTGVTGHHSRSSGDLVFRDGSIFRINALAFTTDWIPDANWAILRLIFNDAEWQYGTGDWTLSKDWFAATYRDDHFKVEMRGKGVILKPAAGTTFTTEFPFEGEGGLVLDGPGTVKFPAETLTFTGTAELRQGTLDASGQSVAVSLTNLSGANAPTLKDCVVTNRILVDLADASVKEGDVLTLANVAGSTTFTDGFKAVNAPAHLRGNVTLADGQLRLSVIRKPGTQLFIR